MDARALFILGAYVSGFFDFLVAIVVIVVALTTVKRVDGASGYVLGGAMGVRFVATCCARVVGQGAAVGAALGAEVESHYDSIQMVSGALSIVRPFFDLALWAAVVFAFVQVAKKVPAQS